MSSRSFSQGRSGFLFLRRPLLGPSDVAGLALNVGYSGHGIMASAGGSRMTVDTMLGRLPPTANPFRPQRPMIERPLDIL